MLAPPRHLRHQPRALQRVLHPGVAALKGRGGTDFRPGFAWLDAQGIEPGVCLYFTDMECSDYPDAEPGFPVAWINWGPAPSEWNREPWGERIDIAA